MTLPQKVKYICLFILIGFSLSTLYHLYVGLYLHQAYPYNTFLFRPEDRFGDFLDIFNAGKKPYGEILANRGMFPFFMLLSYILYSLDHKVRMLALFLILLPSTLAILIWRFLNQESIWLRLSLLFILLFCSYPVLISFDRANIEVVTFILIFLSVILCRQKKYLLAAIFMGIALAFKPYSFFFLPIFLIEG